MLPLSLLRVAELIFPLSLYAGAAVAANSQFKIQTNGTGSRYATSMTGDNVWVSTVNDESYTVNITLGGQNYTVILDTGSSDLWVNTASPRTPQTTNTTNLAVDLIYGQGEIQGNIDFAEFRVGDFVIESQAFINPTTISDFDLAGVDGIMGMAFDVGNVYSAIQQAWGTDAADDLGRAPITNLFAQNTSLPNNFDVQLGRTAESDVVANGVFMISGHASLYASAVESAPQLQRVSNQHWSIVMDAMQVNGNAFTFNQSRISGVPSGTIVAALDTGFSFPPLPAPAVDAIYSTIPGAEFDPASQFWVVPCTASTNLSFTFAGQEFPVHPVDLTYPLVIPIPINGSSTPTNVTICINTYQYLTLDPSSFVGFDIILGDAFLRNVYASFDYGDYYPTNRTNGLPFVQMVSTTDVSTMWAEFAQLRNLTLSQLPPELLSPAEVVKYDTESSSSGSSDTDISGALSSDDSSSSSGSADSWTSKYGMVALGLLGANLLVGVLLLVVTLTMCVRGVKGKSVGSRYAPVRFKEPVDDTESGHLKYSD